MTIISLLTDFGTRDEYVGVIKGVIYGIHAEATIVDLSHEVPPQDVRSAAYLLLSAYGYFPEGSIHVAVVDPGVGSKRKILAAKISGHLFLAPDNGLLGPVMARGRTEALVTVEAPGLYLQPVSQTFHGRDIFAPLAAHLSLGCGIERLGNPMEPGQTVSLPDESPRFNSRGALGGRVVRVDHFGNLITDISLEQLTTGGFWEQPAAAVIQVGGATVEGIGTCYADAHPGKLLALIGSSKFLEISVSMGNAAETLKTKAGAKVTVSKS